VDRNFHNGFYDSFITIPVGMSLTESHQQKQNTAKQWKSTVSVSVNHLHINFRLVLIYLNATLG